MKLDKEVLLEIVSVFQKGIIEGIDVSDLLRSLDLEEKDGLLMLTSEYKNNRK